jgi:hypothetical protein
MIEKLICFNYSSHFSYRWICENIVLFSLNICSFKKQGYLEYHLSIIYLSTNHLSAHAGVIVIGFTGVIIDWLWCETIHLISLSILYSTFPFLALIPALSLWSNRGKVQNERNSFYSLWCFQRYKKCHALQCVWVTGKMTEQHVTPDSVRWPDMWWQEPGEACGAWEPTMTAPCGRPFSEDDWNSSRKDCHICLSFL